MTTERNHTIDNLRGLAIFLMVLGHITRTAWLRQYIYSFHIPVFFFISGYLYNPEKFSSFVVFLKRKFKGLIVPYLILGGFTYLYWLIVESRFRGSDLNPLQQLLGFALGSNYGFFLDFNCPLWFFPCLFSMGIIYYFVDKLKSPIYKILVSFSIFMVGVLVKDVCPWLPFGICAAMIGLAFYGMGGYLRNYQTLLCKVRRMICGHKLLSVFVVALMLIAQFACSSFSVVDLANCIIGNPVTYLGLAVFGTIVYWMASVLIGQSRMLEWAGKNSLVICALHGPVYRALLFIISSVIRLQLDDIRSNVLLCVVISVLTIGTITPFVYAWNKWGKPLTI